MPLSIDALIAKVETGLAALDRQIHAEFDLRDREIVAAYAAAQRAIDKAEATITERLRGFPEIYAKREQIETIEKALGEIREGRSAYLSRDAFDREHKLLQEAVRLDIQQLQVQIDDLKRYAQRGAGAALGGRALAGLIGAVGVIVTIVVLVTNHAV